MEPFAQQITFIYTADLERSTRFYTDVLGLPMVLDQGSCRVFRAAGEAFLGVCLRPAAVSPDGVIVTLVTDDVDGCHRELETAGVEVVQEPAENHEYRIRHAFYRDPDGYLVEIQTFRDPRWPAPTGQPN